jgi:hypothetical protein
VKTVAAELTKTVSVKVTPDVPKRLRELAFDKRMSKADLLRSWLHEKLSESGNTVSDSTSDVTSGGDS